MLSAHPTDHGASEHSKYRELWSKRVNTWSPHGGLGRLGTKMMDKISDFSALCGLSYFIYIC